MDLILELIYVWGEGGFDDWEEADMIVITQANEEESRVA
jgi:hypothetical protein